MLCLLGPAACEAARRIREALSLEEGSLLLRKGKLDLTVAAIQLLLGLRLLLLGERKRHSCFDCIGGGN